MYPVRWNVHGDAVVGREQQLSIYRATEPAVFKVAAVCCKATRNFNADALIASTLSLNPRFSHSVIVSFTETKTSFARCTMYVIASACGFQRYAEPPLSRNSTSSTLKRAISATSNDITLA